MRYVTVYYLSRQTFAATELNEMFFGRQPRQDMKVLLRFGCWLRLHFQSDITKANDFVLTLPSHQQYPKDVAAVNPWNIGETSRLPENISLNQDYLLVLSDPQ
jgi:hypothetical protein